MITVRKIEILYRRPKTTRAHRSKSGSEQALRQPTRQSDGSLPPATKVRTGDVKDEYLRGRVADPFSPAHYGGKRK